jgi:hypothetical protein
MSKLIPISEAARLLGMHAEPRCTGSLGKISCLFVVWVESDLEEEFVQPPQSPYPSGAPSRDNRRCQNQLFA